MLHPPGPTRILEEPHFELGMDLRVDRHKMVEDKLVLVHGDAEVDPNWWGHEVK